MHSILVIALIILSVQLLCVDSAIIRGQSISRQKSKNNQETLDTALKEIDFEDIEANETFACYKCSGKYCHRAFIKYMIRVERVVCEPGEICWLGESTKGTLRGCGSRECSPSESIFKNLTQQFKPDDFADSYCCIDELCNSVNITKWACLPIFLTQMLCFFRLNF